MVGRNTASQSGGNLLTLRSDPTAQTDPIHGIHIVNILKGPHAQSRCAEPESMLRQDAAVLTSAGNHAFVPKTVADGLTNLQSFTLAEDDLAGYRTIESDGMDLFDSDDIDHSWMMAEGDFFPVINRR